MTEMDVRDWRDAIHAYEVDETMRLANTIRMGGAPYTKKGNEGFEGWFRKLARSRKILLNLHKVYDKSKWEKSWKKLNGRSIPNNRT